MENTKVNRKETFKPSLITAVSNWDFKAGPMVGLQGICESLKQSKKKKKKPSAFLWGEGINTFISFSNFLSFKNYKLTPSFWTLCMWLEEQRRCPPVTAWEGRWPLFKILCWPKQAISKIWLGFCAVNCGKLGIFPFLLKGFIYLFIDL